MVNFRVILEMRLCDLILYYNNDSVLICIQTQFMALLLWHSYWGVLLYKYKPECVCVCDWITAPQRNYLSPHSHLGSAVKVADRVCLVFPWRTLHFSSKNPTHVQWHQARLCIWIFPSIREPCEVCKIYFTRHPTTTRECVRIICQQQIFTHFSKR